MEFLMGVVIGLYDMGFRSIIMKGHVVMMC